MHGSGFQMSGMATGMIAVGILVIALVMVLVWYFTRPARAIDIPSSHPSWPARPGREEDDTSHSAERDTFMVIPDISGYTRFIGLNRFSAGHAQYVITQLLDAIIEAAQPPLTASRVEGDSIVFYAVSDREYPDTGVTEDTLSGVILDLTRAYYLKRDELGLENGCPCEACRHIQELDIKVIVHRGPVARYRLKGLEDLSGMTVIEAHRLLKNSLGMDRYILVTEATFEGDGISLTRTIRGHSEVHEGIGEIACDVYEFDPDTLLDGYVAGQGSRLGAKTRDIVGKLGENAGSLRRSLGLG